MKNEGTVGVLVARFQGHRMHEGWRSLVDRVRSEHDKTLIALGVHGGVRTLHDPLTFEEREIMVREVYPEESVQVAPLRDNPISSEWWSEDLDSLIVSRFPDYRPVLNGSRKSFIPLYSGRFETRELDTVVHYSGTQLRADAKMATTEAGREAIIFALKTGFNRIFSTVDIAVIRGDHVLLIGKDSWRHLWAFPGGFCEPKSASDREDAMREAGEELPGITMGNLRCITPDRITMNDPRYRDSGDRVRSTLFVAPYQSGETKGGDDAQRAKWLHRSELSQHVVPWHRPLVAALEASWPRF